ncbi:MAG: acetyl-CoA carboxylase biotin carboxyl carrier protein [Opitutaceae bacterium]
MDLKEIKQIIDLMKRSDLSEFAVEEEGFKLKIRRGTSGAPVVTHPAPQPTAGQIAEAVAVQAPPPQRAQAQQALPPAEEAGVVYIKSPMVGTFYRAPSPDNPSFVDVSSKVQETTPVCIIEAMKIMNEIQAEMKGTILEILAENGQPVEFGQRLFKVKSS